ncbi:MAG TPA: ParB N-terminal domain-containing protein [Candidatus Sulfotelmatobacter sp.]|nr:ParB N-terminal domain-containing protein [Candidatus Sulfotelmatobacter sp.]
MNSTNQLKLLYPSQLLQHSKNMRRFYPKDQVDEMAESIAAHRGVLEPLIVTPGKDGKYLVIDGNMRLAGANKLGAKCPALECKVVDQKEGEQMLSMVTANKVRYDVDPVSEALHFKALKAQGLSVRDISKFTGVYEVRIHNRLVLASLEEDIQQLIVDEKLPADHRVATALLSLTSSVRLKLAKRLASNPNITIKTCLKACENLLGGKKTKKRRHPAAELALGTATPRKGNAGDVRAAAAKTCRECTNYEALGGRAAEPAWSLVVHSANDTCDGCSLKDIQNVCGQCPAVELLRKLSAKESK